MNFEKLVKSGYMKRFVTDILYAGLVANDVFFLSKVYETYRTSGCRIGYRQASKISSEAGNAAYEDIIYFIVGEICSKSNKGLYQDFIDYYLKIFPFVKEQFENSANDVNKWLQLYFEDHKHKYRGRYGCGCFHMDTCESEYDFICRTFILLYCMTYGESGAVDKFMGMIDVDGVHYEKGDFRFYDKKNIYVNYYQMVGEYTHTSDIRSSEQFVNYVFVQKMFLAKHLGMSLFDLAESMVNYMTREIPASLLDFNGCHGNRDYPAMLMLEGLNMICRHHDMNQIVEFNNPWWDRYKEGIFEDLFEQMCIEKLYMTCIDSKTRGESLDLDGLCERGHDNIDAFVRELMVRFWFECYLRGQAGMQEEYYKNFCPWAYCDTKESLYYENKQLKEELSQCKEEIKKYEAAEKRRKKRQEAKKKSMKEKEKIVSLDEKQEEEKKA